MGRARRIQSISPGDKQARCLWIFEPVGYVERRKLNRKGVRRAEGRNHRSSRAAHEASAAAQLKRYGMPLMAMDSICQPVKPPPAVLPADSLNSG